MTLTIKFERDISIENTRLILNTLRKSKASGYYLNTQLGKIRQLHHKSLQRDKVDSILGWLERKGIKATATFDGN